MREMWEMWKFEAKPSWCQCWRIAQPVTWPSMPTCDILWPCCDRVSINSSWTTCASHHTPWSSFGSTTRVQNHEVWKYNFQNCESHIGREGEPAWRAAFAVETEPEILFHRGDFPGALPKSSKTHCEPIAKHVRLAMHAAELRRWRILPQLNLTPITRPETLSASAAH